MDSCSSSAGRQELANYLISFIACQYLASHHLGEQKDGGWTASPHLGSSAEDGPDLKQTEVNVWPVTGSLAIGHQYSSLGTQPILCGSIPGLVPKQLRFCRNYVEIMPSVAEGVKIGIQECQHQFRGRRWNCTTVNDSLAIFGPVLDKELLVLIKVDGMGWDGMGWDGMGWDGMGWDGMGWDGTGWDGMGQDGMRCDVMRCDVMQCDGAIYISLSYYPGRP
ncbi:hypothetical protein Q9966_011852 [Columba livia]|nr:hypothetical protein Q9966_011852 [Columba livia]